MNTHPVKPEDVMAYLDGELSPNATAEVTAHLARCRACQEIAGDVQSVSRQLASWVVEPKPDEIPPNIAVALDSLPAKTDKRKPSIWHRHFVARLPQVAIVLLAIVLVPAAVILFFSRAPHLAMSDKALGLQPADLAQGSRTVEPALANSLVPAPTAQLEANMQRSSPWTAMSRQINPKPLRTLRRSLLAPPKSV